MYDDLGIVELVMEMEQRLRIRVPDDALQHVRTAGDFADIVCDLVAARPMQPEDRCRCARLFYELRPHLTKLTDGDSRAIRPSTALTHFLQDDPHGRWHRLGETADVRLPGLLLPRWIWILAALLPTVVVALSVSIAAGTLVLAGVFAATFIVQSFCGTRPPHHLQSLGDVIAFRLIQDARRDRQKAHASCSWRRDEVWLLVRQAIAELALRPYHQIKRNTEILPIL